VGELWLKEISREADNSAENSVNMKSNVAVFVVFSLLLVPLHKNSVALSPVFILLFLLLSNPKSFESSVYLKVLSPLKLIEKCVFVNRLGV